MKSVLGACRLHACGGHDPVVGVAFIVVAIICGIMEIFKPFVSHSYIISFLFLSNSKQFET